MRRFNAFMLSALLLEVLSARPMAGKIEANATISALQIAQDLSRRGEFTQALEKYQAFLSKPTSKLTPELQGYVLSQIADSDNGLGDYLGGEANAREALRILQTANEANPEIFAIAEGVLADALRGKGDYFDEKSTAELAVSIGRHTFNPLAPRFAILLSILARAFEDNGKLSHALKLYQEALFIFEKGGPDCRVGLGSAYSNIAATYLRHQNPKKALQYVNFALHTWQGVLPPDHVFKLYALNTEMLSHEKLRQYQQAEALIPNMLRLGSSLLAPDHPDRISLLNNVASVYLAEKKYDQAEPLLESAVTLSERELPVGHPISRRVLVTYAFVLAKLNRSEEASRVRAQSEILLAFPERSKSFRAEK